jgi:murein DD-endopeptidase MepM/ murein hydrolase activator NlpD
MGKEAFFEQYKEFAIQQQIKYGIPASVTLAQAAIESSYGDNVAAKQANNFFGIHAVPAWLKRGDPVMYYNDASQNVPFTKHESAEASFEYHSKFLLLNSRQYGRCFGLSATDADGWAKGICEGGYAERRPGKEYAYYNTIMSVIKQNNLQKYDQEAVERASKQNVVCGYDRKNISVEAARTTVAAPKPDIAMVGQGGSEHFRMPIEGYTDMKMTSPFGMRTHPTTGKYSMHNGIDISIPTGTQLFSSEDRGVVKRVNWGVDKNGDGKADLDKNGNPVINGKCVEVEYRHGNDVYTVQYLHMSRVDVKEGQEVDHNTLLGLSGSTGRGTGAHLHYGVMKNGQYINPVTYLADIAVLSESDAKIKDLKHGSRDVLAMEKQNVNTGELLAHKADLDRTNGDSQLMHQQYDLAQQQQLQQGQQAPGQQQQVSTPGGLATLLWGDKAKDMDLGFGGSGDLIGDLFAMLLTGVVAMFASVNKTTEQEVRQQMDQQQNKKEEEKYDATVDRSLVAEAKAKGVDPKVLEQQTQLQADAGLGELDQQRQQQRGMSMS